VIYAAYSAVDPQKAFNYSQQLSDYGSGNSATNQLYFISTRSSASDICSASLQTPQGTYYIQDASSGKYVQASSSGALSAVATDTSDATAFDLAFMPGGGSIMASSNKMYVTADPNGQSPLSAARTVVSSYETFRWIPQSDGSYELEALVNRAEVASASAGLLNNANSTNGEAAGKYKLVKANVNTLKGSAVLSSAPSSVTKSILKLSTAPTQIATAKSSSSSVKKSTVKLSTKRSHTTTAKLSTSTVKTTKLKATTSARSTA